MIPCFAVFDQTWDIFFMSALEAKEYGLIDTVVEKHVPSKPSDKDKAAGSGGST